MEATEREIYDSAITEEQIENTTEEPAEAPTEAKTSRTRDDKGKFVSQPPEAPEEVVQETAPQPEVETQETTDAKVPSWRLAEEAQRRRDAERQLEDMRAEFRQMQMQWQQVAQQRQPQQQEPIDPFADPQGFASSLQQQFAEQIAGLRLENSLSRSRDRHGDSFDKAYEAFIDHSHRTRDQATYQRVMQAGDPGQALVDWYKEQELHKELGGSDLKAFLEKQREEWLKDPSVQAKVIEAFKASQQQTQPTNNITQVPPSLSRATASQGAHEDIDVKDGRGMYAYATAKR